jgi:prepilin-type N-terminal cleavage/methylation domain-containing protein
MSMTNQDGGTPDAGFTLLEMLVVLAILALVMSFAGPFVSEGSEGVRLETASNGLAAALRLTRSAAIVRNVETTLMMDVDKRVFGSIVVPQRPFARCQMDRMTAIRKPDLPWSKCWL